MVQSLSKKFVLLFAMAVAAPVCAQTTDVIDLEKDYKDPKSHEHFRKRRLGVSAWQINQLKEGALVVRLNTNQLLINGFKKEGMDNEAEKVRLQQAAINKNIIRSYNNKYNFSKVYFIYSQSSDSLLKGTRSGIFVDSNLAVVPGLTMNEKFYLLAETDFIYNSSIGFVPEDSAAKVIERGNPSSSEVPIVVKNKYGHQLKSPFPYAISKTIYSRKKPVEYVHLNGERIPFEVVSATGGGGNGSNSYKVNGKYVVLTIPRMYTYEVMSQVVEELNAELTEFYRDSARISESSKEYQEGKPFFY